jgi:hypothetical protein
MAVTGAPPWNVQWYSNGVPISGANGQTYTIGPVQDTANGSIYSVSVSNLAYGVNSTNALLSVSRDTTPPMVAKVTSFQPNQVTVLFSKPLDPTTSQNSANYTITNGVGSVIAVSTATLGADNETVTLTTATFTEGTTYYLNPNNIQDLASIPNKIAPGTVVPFVYTTLVGWWRFGEGSGTITADSSLDGATGTLVNGPIWTPRPFSLWCLSFNGVNQWVDVGNPPALQITGPLTLSAWVNPNSQAITTGGRVVAKGGASGNRGYSLAMETDGNFSFVIAPTSTNTDVLEVPNWVPFGQWQHVAGVYDPNNAYGPMLLMYTNGVLAGTNNVGISPSQVDSGLDVQIGNRPDEATPWAGLIDEVRIYSRALPNREIAQLAAPIFVETTLTNNQATLNWAGQGQLQSAPAVTGVYTNIIPPPTPPWSFTIVPGQNQFFRLAAPLP